eukprot:293916_1
MVVRGRDKVKVGGLQEETFYSLRAKRGDVNDEKVDDEFWNNAATTSFKTKSDEQMQMDGKEQEKTIIGLKSQLTDQKKKTLQLDQSNDSLREELQALQNQYEKLKKKMLNNAAPVASEQKDEFKSHDNKLVLTQYDGVFIKENVSKLFTVINIFAIQQTEKAGSLDMFSQTAKMDSVLPAYNSNSNIIVYWKIQFVDNKFKKGFNNPFYFVGVISDTVWNMNNGPVDGIRDSYGILGSKGYVVRGQGYAVKDNSFVYSIKDKEIIEIKYYVSKSILVLEVQNKQIGTFKLPKNKCWCPAVSFNCRDFGGQTCNVLFSQL